MKKKADPKLEDPIPTPRCSQEAQGKQAKDSERTRDAMDFTREQESQERRAARVECLRDLIARGKYTPDPHDVARAMIEKGF